MKRQKEEMNEPTTVKPLEDLGYTLDSFHIQDLDHEGRHFTYYTFDEHYKPEYLNRWEIIGLYQRSSDPWLLDMRCVHIEQVELEEMEMFEESEFSALEYERTERDLSLNPATLRALITFLQDQVIEWEETDHNIALFHRMAATDLEHMRFPFWKIPSLQRAGYRYTPDENVQSKEEITLICFPVWNAQYGANQTTTFEYDSFHKERLDDPSFILFATTRAIGTVTLNQRALKELIILLEQHSYEAFGEGLKHGPALST